jgi:hypothetical protein
MSVEDSLWYVKLADGDVERVTLDQLDEAFQNGQIDENSMVLAAGSDQWMRLADLLQASDATPPPPPPTPVPQRSAQPAVMQATVAQPAPFGARPAAQAPFVHSPGTPQRPAAAGFIPASTLRPISLDLGGDVDIHYPKRSRKGVVVGVLGTALVLGGAAFFAVTRTAGSASADTTPAFAAAAAVPLPAPTTPPEPAAAPAPPAQLQASNGGSSSVMDPTHMGDSPQRLTDGQKQKLLDADKTKKPTSHERSHSGGGSVAAHSPPKSKSPTFTTGGNKFDPLNSSL